MSLDLVFFAFFASCAATSGWLLVAIAANRWLFLPYLDRLEAADV
ncbi:hypothetical protein [Kitasatospora sp. GP82]|nr:hypothetical protein [Kitasatospora sp. GP82]MDH6126903.1 hypothetical protein [Kitasatospora sp. GP82]